MKKLFLLFIVITIPFFSVSAQTAQKKALLAMEGTSFKKALIAEMKTALEKSGIKVTVVSDHKKEIENFKASDFDYVFITNSGVNSMVRPWIVKWLDENRSSKNILLHTTKIKKWREQVAVDAVSSASDKKNASILAQEYVDLLLLK